MAIRLRRVEGQLIALCAVETDPELGDVYLDDGAHYALSLKFAEDWNTSWQDGSRNKVALTQKKRNAREEVEKWVEEAGKTTNPVNEPKSNWQ